MTTTTKLAVFYGFAPTMRDQINATFKQSGVDCLHFDAMTHANCSDQNVGSLEESDSFDKRGARSQDLLDERIKSVIDVLGDRKIDFLVVSPSTNRELPNFIGGDYAAWRNELFECLETPLFLSTYLIKYLTPEARLLFLFNHSAFVPLIGQGNYSVSQYALRMAVNILSVERPETFISSALIDEDSFSVPVEIDSNKTLSVKEEANSPSMAKFLKWLLLTIKREVFFERQWDSRDKDIQSLWQENRLHH